MEFEVVELKIEETKIVPAELEIDLTQVQTVIDNIEKTLKEQTFSEENLARDKKSLSNVNALKGTLTEKRKELQDKVMPPDVSNTIKQIMDMEKQLGAGYKSWKSQITEYEDTLVQAKILTFKERFEEWKQVMAKEFNEPGIVENLTYSMVKADKEHTKAFKMKNFEEKLDEEHKKLETDFRMIEFLPNKELIVSYYLNSFEMSEAIEQANAHVLREREAKTRATAEKAGWGKTPETEEEIVIDIDDIDDIDFTGTSVELTMTARKEQIEGYKTQIEANNTEIERLLQANAQLETLIDEAMQQMIGE